MAEFKYAPMFQLGEDTTQYYKIPGSEKLVKTTQLPDGKTLLEVSPEALTLVAQQSFHDCQFMLRRAHNEQVAAILNDPEASENDKYVALQFLRNAETSVKGSPSLLPGHRHRHHPRREGPGSLDRFRGRGGAEPRRIQHLHAGESPLQPERSPQHV